MDKYTADRVQQIWDQTSLNTAMCPRKYKYEKVDGWRTPYRSEAPEFGTFAHTAYEEYDKVIASGGDYEEAVEAAAIYVLENGEHLNQFQTAQYSVSTLLRDIVWYGEQFKDDIFPLALDQEGAPLIEVRFEVPIPGMDNRRFSGRIDKVVLENDDLILVDRKFTKSTLTNYYFDAYQPSIQLTAYVWAARRMLNLPVSKVMIEAHQIGSTLNRVERRSFFVPDDRLEDFEQELPYMIAQIDKAHETGYWPRDIRMCHSYGGCAFRRVCDASKNSEAFLLGELFVKG